MADYCVSSCIDKREAVIGGAGFELFIKNELGKQIAETIFAEVQTGEKIVTLGDIRSREIMERCQIEMQQAVRITDLVRCKECVHFKPFDLEERNHVLKELDGWCWNGDMVTLQDYCSGGVRRSDEN